MPANSVSHRSLMTIPSISVSQPPTSTIVFKPLYPNVAAVVRRMVRLEGCRAMFHAASCLRSQSRTACTSIHVPTPGGFVLASKTRPCMLNTLNSASRQFRNPKHCLVRQCCSLQPIQCLSFSGLSQCTKEQVTFRTISSIRSRSQPLMYGIGRPFPPSVEGEADPPRPIVALV